MPSKIKVKRSRWLRYICPSCEHGVVAKGAVAVKCTSCGKRLEGVVEAFEIKEGKPEEKLLT